MVVSANTEMGGGHSFWDCCRMAKSSFLPRRNKGYFGKKVKKTLFGNSPIKGAIKMIPGTPYPYFVTGCPDGEPAGFQEMVAVDPVAARKLKEEYKYSLGGFSKGFVDRIVDSVRGLADGTEVKWAG